MNIFRQLTEAGVPSAKEGHDKLLQAEDGDLESDSENDPGRPLPERRRRRWSGAFWVLSSLMFGLYSLLLTLYVIKKPTEFECAKRLSVWSPLNEAVEYQDVKIENRFDHQTKYRGPPNPELEQAWDDLWQVGVVPFPEDKLVLVNKTAELPDGRTLQPSIEDEHSYGAQFEVFHQLHCLNILRQYTWRDWYLRHEDIVETPNSVLDSDVGARMHVDHCIEALRINIMCQGDTTPFFTVLDSAAPLGAQADFSPQRKCRNFERLQSWAIENMMQDPRQPHT